MTKFQLAINKKYKGITFKGYDCMKQQFILEKDNVEFRRRCFYNKDGEYFFKLNDIRYYLNMFEEV